MSILESIFKKAYWLAVFSVPLLPAYVYSTFPETRNCSINGICSQTTSIYINSEAISIMYFSIVLLVPLSLWELMGKHIAERLRFFRSYQGKAGTAFFKFASGLYFFMAALIPLLFWYMFSTFFAPYDCDETMSCFHYRVPLSSDGIIAVLIACLVLWPMCIMKTIGILSKFKLSARTSH